MKRITATKNLILDALSAKPGSFGTLYIDQDDIGGHIITLNTGNTGIIVLNTLPRARTELNWKRTDREVNWTSLVLDPGIKPTTLPTIRIDDRLDTLEVLHSLPDSEILMSVNDGPWINYPGLFSIGAVDRPPGYWKFKIKEGFNPPRLESGISSSLQVYAAKKGFTFKFPVPLA